MCLLLVTLYSRPTGIFSTMRKSIQYPWWSTWPCWPILAPCVFKYLSWSWREPPLILVFISDLKPVKLAVTYNHTSGWTSSRNKSSPCTFLEMTGRPFCFIKIKLFEKCFYYPTSYIQYREKSTYPFLKCRKNLSSTKLSFSGLVSMSSNWKRSLEALLSRQMLIVGNVM